MKYLYKPDSIIYWLCIAPLMIIFLAITCPIWICILIGYTCYIGIRDIEVMDDFSELYNEEIISEDSMSSEISLENRDT